MKTLSKIITILLSAAAVFAACGKEENGPAEVKDFFLTSPASGSLTLTQNEDFRIKFGTVPEEAAGTVLVEWSIDDPDIATVKNGRVTPQRPGKAVITVKCGKFTETVNLTVKGIPVTSFSVPAELNAYYGNPKEIPLTVEPAEANAASLNWYVEDENVAYITFEDGKAYINATSEAEDGVTAVTVSADDMEPQTIEVNACPRGVAVLYTYTDRTVIFDDVEGKELDFNLLSFSDADNAADLLYIAVNKVSSLDIKVDNPKICTVSKALVSDAVGTWYSIFVGAGSEYGTTGVTITTQMDGLTFTTRFSVRREPLVFPEGVCIYNADKKCAMADEEEVTKGQTINLMLTAGGQVSYPAKWTSSDASLATVKTSDGKEYSRKAIVSVSGSKTGKVTISATDESGTTSKSVVLNVTAEKFSAGVYLIDVSSGEKIEKGSVHCVEYGFPFEVKLSESYKNLTWSSADESALKVVQDAGNPVKARITIADPEKTVVLRITDESGSTTLEYSFCANLSLRTLFVRPALGNYNDVVYYSKPGASEDWIFMPYVPGRNLIQMELTDSKGHTVMNLADGGWSAELVSGHSTDVLKRSGISYYDIVTYSPRDKHILIKDKFGNEKNLIVRPTPDFRNKGYEIWESLDSKERNIEYNNDGTMHGAVSSLAGPGTAYEDYELYTRAVGTVWCINIDDFAKNIIREECKINDIAYSCNGLHFTSMEQLFKFLNDDPSTFKYYYKNGMGNMVVQDIYAYHKHHNRHKVQFKLTPINGQAEWAAKTSKLNIYGECQFQLDMD